MLSKPDVESSDGRYFAASIVEVQQIADDVRVLRAIQPMQSGRRRERLSRSRSSSFSNDAIIASKSAGSGRFMPSGGICPARTLRTTSSHFSRSLSTFAGSSAVHGQPTR